MDNSILTSAAYDGVWADAFRIIQIKIGRRGDTSVKFLATITGRNPAISGVTFQENYPQHFRSQNTIQPNSFTAEISFVETDDFNGDSNDWPSIGSKKSESKSNAKPLFTPTTWNLNLQRAQVVICPADAQHNMIKLTPDEEPHPSEFSGWFCDVCNVPSNPRLVNPAPKLSRFFCSKCMADVCLRCADASQQFEITLSGTSTSGEMIGQEAFSFVRAEDVNAYVRAFNDKQTDMAEISARTRKSMQKDAYAPKPEPRGLRWGDGGVRRPPRGRAEAGARMLLASSGRDNFEDLRMDPTVLLSADEHDQRLATTRCSMIAMLIYEANLRKSSSVQRLLGVYPGHGEAIFLAIQYQVARKMGFINPAIGCAAIRAAATLFPGDDELLHVAAYRRYNRSGPCSVRPGNAFPDVPLYALPQLDDDKAITKPCQSPLCLSEWQHLITSQQRREEIPLIPASA